MNKHDRKKRVTWECGLGDTSSPYKYIGVYDATMQDTHTNTSIVAVTGRAVLPYNRKRPCQKLGPISPLMKYQDTRYSVEIHLNLVHH